MLILSRKKDQLVTIDVPPSDESQQVKVMVTEIKGDKVRLGFEADESITILRKEIKKKHKREKQNMNDNSNIWPDIERIIIQYVFDHPGCKYEEIEDAILSAFYADDKQIDFDYKRRDAHDDIEFVRKAGVLLRLDGTSRDSAGLYYLKAGLTVDEAVAKVNEYHDREWLHDRQKPDAHTVDCNCPDCVSLETVLHDIRHARAIEPPSKLVVSFDVSRTVVACVGIIAVTLIGVAYFAFCA